MMLRAKQSGQRERLGLSTVTVLSVWFNRYWFDQVRVSIKNTAAANLLWL